MSSSSRSLVGITILLLFAAFLRLYQIDAQNIWADEGFTYLITQQADVLPMLRADVHPPLYFLGMKAWALAAGTSEIALRLPSALASIITVALIFLLGRELVRWHGQNPDVSPIPLLAALLLALSDLEIDLSHEARMYTIQTALATLSVLAYFRWARAARTSDLWILGGIAALLVYINYLGVWIPLVIGLHALLCLRGRQRSALLGMLTLSALTVLPWLLLVGRDQLGNGTGADRADSNSLDTLRVYRDNWFGQQWPLMIGLFGLGTVFVEYLPSVRIRLRPYRVTVFLLLWVLVPLVLTILANYWIPVLAAHRISQITPAICLLVAIGLSNFPPPSRVFLATVILVSALTSVDFYRIKGPWQEYTQTITPFVQPGDLVLMEIGGGDTMLEYYFDRRLPVGAELVSMKRWREGTPDAFYAGILPLLETHNTVWLLHWSSETAVFDWLSETGYVQTMRRETLHIQDSRLDSYRFDRIPGPPIAEFGELQLEMAEIVPDKLRIDLLWATDVEPAVDFVTSAFLLNAQGVLVAQLDTQPMLNQRPTSGWSIGRHYYDPKLLVSSNGDPLPPGVYQAGVVVYYFVGSEPQRLLTEDGVDSLIIGTLTVEP